MFIKVTCSCGSRDVMHFKQNGTRLDQYCQCGNNLTAPQIRKQVRTRRINASKTRYKPRRASKTSRSKQSTTYAIGLVLLAIFSVVAYGATAYAEMSEPMVYKAENKVPEFVSPVIEDVYKPETIVNKFETKAEIREYVLSEAKKAGVHVAKIDHIVENESHYDPNAVGDKNVPCTNKKSPLYGKGAHARGLWQITRCWYPNISDEQAHSVEWSTKWALQIIANSKNDCITQWTTCRKWYKI